MLYPRLEPREEPYILTQEEFRDLLNSLTDDMIIEYEITYLQEGAQYKVWIKKDNPSFFPRVRE